MKASQGTQGVIAVCAVREYASLDDILALAGESRGRRRPLHRRLRRDIRPHNLGAIIRSAECVGAHGVVIPKRRSAGLTAVVGKTSASAGTCRRAGGEHLRRAAGAQGPRGSGSTAPQPRQLPMWETDLTGPLALVIGSEERGLGRLVREALRLPRQHPPARQGGLAQRLHRRRRAHVRVLRQKLAK